MKIVCLGWGSLIWNPQQLKIEKEWYTDGPWLPVEFTRISGDNRVTLIIDTDAEPVQTLWASATTNNLQEFIDSLKIRERTREKNIHWINCADTTADPIKSIIKDWLLEKKLDTAVWTGLSFSSKTNNQRPSVEEVITHLKGLATTTKEKSEEYIRKTPAQIATEYRQEIEKALNREF